MPNRTHPTYVENFERARTMRSAGATYVEIARAFGGSRSSWQVKLTGADWAVRVRRSHSASGPMGPPLPKVEKTPRTCIGPGCQGRRSFLSSGKGNRLCKECSRLVGVWEPGAYL